MPTENVVGIFPTLTARKRALSEAIPREVALQLCTEIRREKEHKWFGQCWGCVKFSKGDFEKMCASGKPGHRGCSLVNDRYDESPRDN